MPLPMFHAREVPERPQADEDMVILTPIPADSSQLEPLASSDHHVHLLQRRLIETYGAPVGDEKLPVAQRLLIITGVSALLWLAIGAAVYAAIQLA